MNKKFLLALSPVLFLGLNAHAETIFEAMSSAYNTNPTLHGERAASGAVNEDAAAARSGFRPTVALQGSYVDSHAKASHKPTVDSYSKRYGGAVVQPLFNGFSTYNSVKAADNAAKAELNNNESKVASEKDADEKKDAKADSKKGSKKNTENTKTSGTGFDNYIVDNVQKLKAGYYVQIASLSDTSNIKGIVSTYSNKYPIEIVPSEVKKNSYQIMIGPLGVDEYGTVLERFKSRGYRDSFIRKVK